MLSSDQVNQYRRQGYCVAHGFLGSAQVAELLADAQTICATATLANHDSTRMEMEPNQGPDGQKVRRLYEPCTHYPRFRALSDSAEVLNSVNNCSDQT